MEELPKDLVEITKDNNDFVYSMPENFKENFFDISTKENYEWMYKRWLQDDGQVDIMKPVHVFKTKVA